MTNTLDDPGTEETLESLFAPISRSRRMANEIKRRTPVTVVIGNPPYRERAEGQGHWVERGNETDKAPLDAFRAEGNGRNEYVLKNLYVYFWRWATWKVFDAHPEQRAGVVAFITTAGYLRGPGFRGMREYLRRTCDEGWIIDVSPEGMRPDVPTRFFPGVQQPLAIGIFVRHAQAADDKPATIRYVALHGRREQKYEQLAALTLDGDEWKPVRDDWQAPFTPASEAGWDEYPALGDLMPWAVPGIKPNRAWVYAPHPEILRKRWSELISVEDEERRRELFKESSDRTIHSVVAPLPGFPAHARSIAKENGPCPEPVRVAYRSFDRQWIIPDNRLLHRPSPDLWRANFTDQIFLSEQHARRLESGPGVVFSALIQDMDHFKGSEGGRVLPMRHPGGTENVAPHLLAYVSARLEHNVTIEDLVSYIAGCVAHRAFVPRFAEELVTPGIRVPLTADPGLWDEAVALGRDIVWLHTYGEAFVDPAAGRPKGKVRYPVDDPRRPLIRKAIPASPLPATISYDERTETLYIGQGELAPVSVDVWAYDVGGMQVVKKWFSYRKAEPGGKVSSPLDKIHAERWSHEWNEELLDLLTVLRRLVELEPQQAELLDRIVTGPLITVADLAAAKVFPVPKVSRKPHRDAFGPDSHSDPDRPNLFSSLP